jgi:hypothetical protein
MAEPDHKRCLGCGYILDGLPEPRCPECGRGFDPSRPSTYTTGPAPRGWWHVLIAFAGVWLAVGVAATHTHASLCGLAVIATALQCYVAARSVRELRKSPVIQPHRGSWMFALVVSIMLILAYLALVVLALPVR